MRPRAKLTVAALTIALLAPTAMAQSQEAPTEPPALPVSLVRVATPTSADKDRLLDLGLDATEHAGADFVEVVVHDAEDLDVLQGSGLLFTTTVPDLAARDAQRQQADAAFAAANPTTALPSGRNAYRSLDDYNAEMAALAQQRPDLVRRFRLPERSVEGRDMWGIEITANPAASSGKPSFVMLGAHHAREWPSGEHAMELAYDLVNGYGNDPRITRLVDGVRTLIVPIVNVDGFHASRTDGDVVDLREVAEGDETAYTGVVYANPGNTYKRKNCRMLDGLDTPSGACALPGNRVLGIDLNRNYGSLWGGNGASALPADDLYRGPAPFSEPETRNIRHLVSTNQVTMLITNHTFSNLIIRPPGVRGYGLTPDEPAMAHIGARMAAQNGYANIHGWELYDTTGTTEDWSYLSTGGFGYTFEIGPDEFHPPFEEVVAEYLGSGEHEGQGNRAAYLIAMEAALDPTYHSVLQGRATPGAVLRLQKTFDTETSPVQTIPTQFTDDPLPPGAVQTVEDHLETTLLVDRTGRFSWHINPSTRPAVGPRQLPPEEGAAEALRTETHENTTATTPGEHIDVPFTVTAAEDGAMLDTTLDWATPDDYDLEVYRVGAGGELTDVTSSGEPPGFTEAVHIDGIAPGDYIFRVVNFAAVNPAWTLTTTISAPAEGELIAGTTETWTLTCERSGLVLATQQVSIVRGQVLGLKKQLC